MFIRSHKGTYQKIDILLLRKIQLIVIYNKFNYKKLQEKLNIRDRF